MKHFLPAVLLLLLRLSSTAGQSCTSDCHGSLGENIYPKGDFGSGIPNVVLVDPGLAPGYIYQTNPPPNDGYYTITNSTTSWGWFAADVWINIEDNGPEPNGYMMVVNASYPPGLFFQNTVPVCENTLYEFSVDVINIIGHQFPQSIRPNLSFMIDNVAYCTTGDIPIDEQWHTVRFSFTTAPGQTSVLLGMRNNAPGGYGNDLAIDNISFRACGPELLAPDTLWFCQGSSAQLQVQLLNSPFASTVYQWQILLNGNWEDIPGANSVTWSVPNPQDGAEYRLLVASAMPNLNVPNCRVVSKAIRLVQLPAVVVTASGMDALCFGQSSATVGAQALSGQPPYAFAWNNGTTGNMMTGLPAGNYLVTITDALGCTADAAVTVNEAPQLVSGMASLPVSCFGGTNGQAIATATGGTFPYSFSWDNGDTGDTIQGLSTGNYLLTITDAHGCSSTISSSIGEPPALAPAASGGATACFGGNDAIATATATGGTGSYTFLWSNGQTTAQVTGLAAGAYVVTVTDAHGCSASIPSSIGEPLALAPAASGGATSCFGGNDAIATATATGGIGPYSFLWSNGQTTAQIAGLAAGAYVLTVTDAHGCSASISSSIGEPLALAPAASGGATSCFGGNDAIATATATGGTGSYTFLWSNGQTTAQVTGLAAGAYVVTVTDAHGCSASTSSSIGEPLALAPATSGGATACFGGNDAIATATATGGTGPYTFLWSNGQTTAQVAGLAAGAYVVTVTDTHGCSATTSGSIGEPLALAPAASGGATSCFGGNDAIATATATGGVGPYSFLWNNGQTTAQLSGLAAGAYVVTITDAHGCSATTSSSIGEPLALAPAASGGATSCFGGNDAIATATASGGTVPYTFLWSNGQSTAQVGGLSAGPYTVTVTDAHGCSATTSASIGQPLALAPAASGGATSCFGGNDANATATASGGTAPYSFLWSNGQSTAQIGGLAAGPYTVTVTDAHGCSASTSSSIAEPLALTPAASGGATSCFGGNDASTTATASGGTAPYSFLWSNGQTTAQIGGLTSGPYTVTITDAHGCTVTATGNIQQPSLLQANTQASAVSCFGGNDATVSASASGGTSPYHFIWSNGQSTALIGGLSTGTYTVTATDGYGCTAVQWVVVDQPPLLASAAVASETPCFGSNDGSVWVQSNGGQAPYQYLWNNGQTKDTLIGLPVGLFSVKITDSKGCTASASAVVTAPSALQSSVTAQDAACFGSADGMATFSLIGGTPPYNYLWQNGQTTAQINGLSSGWYGLSITDAHQCPGVTQVWVGQPPPLMVNPLALPVSCPEVADGMASVTASGGVGPYLFAWSNGQLGPEIAALAMGVYTVTATDAHGCTAVGEETVESALPLEVDLGLDQTLILGDEMVLTAHTNLPHSEILDYNWTGSGGVLECADCFQYQFLPVESGCERVLVRNVKGCQASDEVCFTIRPKRRIYVPNVFHPDDSGENDYFTIYSDASVKQILYLKIYSRWGEQIFQANNIQTNHEPSGWDGFFRGQPMNPGVFVWVAEVEFIDGEVLFLKGDVTLVR